MRVLIIDDDKLVCASLKTILEMSGEIEVSGIGHSGKEAVALYKKLTPDVLLMDIRMENGNGLAAAEEILQGTPSAKVLFLTTFTDDDYVAQALRIGAKGYILKQNFESIVTALKAVSLGQSVFGEDIITKIPSLIKQKNEPNMAAYDISEKEAGIIALVAEGLSNKEIADTLYLSEGTVRNYISIILEKLQLRDRTQLAIFYFKNLS